MSRASNTKSGREVKEMIAKCILSNPPWWRALLDALGGYEGARVESSVPNHSNQKADVCVTFKTPHAPIWLKVKSFTDSDYSHLRRRPLSGFCADHQIKADDEKFLEKCLLHKAENPRKNKLIEPADQIRAKRIFAPFERDVRKLLERGGPKIFAICDRNHDRCHFYLMRDVEKDLLGPINFTRNGNVAIGDYLNIQRKGPDKRGVSSMIDIDHSSNDVQVKMHVEKFFKNVVPVAVCSKQRDA